MLFRSIRSAQQRAATVAGVADEAAFARILARERDRADRTHDVLAVVTLPLGDAQRLDPEWCRRLGRLLCTRLRSTDEAGWLPGACLGIALPHTSASGAWALVEDMRARLERYTTRYSPLPFSVHAHTGHGGRDGSWMGPRPLRRARLPERRPSAAIPQRAVLALEPLLLQPPGLAKRALDVVLGALGLAVSAPVLAAAALAVRCSSPGPIFFRQERAGYGGRPFTLYKLRTMVERAEEIKPLLVALNESDGPTFKIQNDPRITRVGRFLRKTSIDELPQLWNVLRGEMSLVGPRPPTLDEVAQYASWQRRRLHAIGGLTCYWQVKGRSNIAFLDWMRLDVRYLRERGLVTDLLLILRTIPAVLAGRGAR